MSRSFFIIFVLLASLAWGEPADPATADIGIGVSEPRYFSEEKLRQMISTVDAKLQVLEDQEFAPNFFDVQSNVGQIQGQREQSRVNVINLHYYPLRQDSAVETVTRRALYDQDDRLVREEVEEPEDEDEEAPDARVLPEAYTYVRDKLSTTTYLAPRKADIPDDAKAKELLNSVRRSLPVPEQYGMSPLQLIREKVSTSFELVNLRHLLAMSFWDRRDMERITVGFDISVQPRDRHENAVAQVTVRVPRGPGKRDQQVSLIHLFPREETYNTVSVTDSVESVGLGMVLGPLKIGNQNSQANSQSYVVQDVDTVAITHETSEYVQFGWQFRPVLGRHFVKPGVRRVYAVLAVPRSRIKERQSTSVKIKVRTEWLDVDRRTGAVGGERDRSRWVNKDILVAEKTRVMPDLLPFSSEGYSSELIDIRDAESPNAVLAVVYGVNLSERMNVWIGDREITDLTVGTGQIQNLLGSDGSKTVSRGPQMLPNKVNAFLKRHELSVAPEERDRGPLWKPNKHHLQTVMFTVSTKELLEQNILTVGNDWGTRSWNLLEVFGEEAFEKF